jgi:hypothetical protein
MNVVELNPTVSDALRRTLAELPEFDAPAARWLDVIAARRARGTAWRRRALLAGVAAAAALAAVALLPSRVAPPAVDGAAVALAQAVQRSHALEGELARARGAGSAALVTVEADLARVDHALQAAYDRGAPPAELEPLWRERAAALETLLAGYRHPDTLIRI